MSPPALRRAVAQGNGWYGFYLNLEAATAMLSSLAKIAKQVERPAGLGPLEITVTPPGPIDADLARQYEDLGVDRIVLMRSMDDMANVGREEDVLRFLEDSAKELSLG
jgi:hypothetical protein